jgi:hypothetical protein
MSVACVITKISKTVILGPIQLLSKAIQDHYISPQVKWPVCVKLIIPPCTSYIPSGYRTQEKGYSKMMG